MWTGAEVLSWDTWNHDEATGNVVHGGRGAAYNPRTDRWRHLPRSPLTNRTWSIVAWTGRELLVIAGACGEGGYDRCEDGAAYDPHANRWRRLPKAPVPGRALPLTAWTGDQAIFVGGQNVGAQLREDRGNIAAITEQGVAWWPTGTRAGG